MDWLRALPVFIHLMGLSSLAMLVPAAHAAATGDIPTMGAFLRAAGLAGVLTALLAAATASQPVRNPARAQLLSLVAAFSVLPALLALPFVAAVPTTTFGNAWFEMISSATTTGATLYAPDRLPE